MMKSRGMSRIMRPIALRDGGRTKKPKVRDLLQRGKPKPPQKPKLPKMGDKPKYTPAMKKGGQAKKTVGKVVKALKKASKSHAGQAKTLSALKLKKGGSTKDACYHKVKARYRVFPSAYASGAIAKCRKVGAANYGKGGKKK